MTFAFHRPVLLGPVLAAARGARRAVDGTLGDGGHAEALRQAGIEVLGIDRDPSAIARARERLGGSGIRYLCAAYSSDEALDAIHGFAPDFILLDLGVSSRQLDDDARGFSFRPGAPLDMRMGDTGPTAAGLLADASEPELEQWFRDYGDERRARALAREIARRRARAPLVVSDDLVNAIRAVLGPRAGPAEFARLFQALRIATNDELAGLERALPALRGALAPGGALAVISYHSGEDRLVKHAFRDWERGCVCPPRQPVCTCGRHPAGHTEPHKPIVSDDAEIADNPRARSARLRVFRMNNDA
ncbi:MAG TPA: 16S rRNA (cytosine(1402)-N(4))-methyltransferase RsmH [Gemmatimonadales bacterium]|nr:16S rRNA (cytosine(1402)-N(4))-methyltransferase RsmH [Gemmatimonadales bacterium]